MAEDNWHYVREGAVQGPFSFTNLRSLAADGRLRPDDWVARVGDRDWRPAAEVPRLFDPPTLVTAPNRALGRVAKWLGAAMLLAGFCVSPAVYCGWSAWVLPPPVGAEVEYRPGAGGGVSVVVRNLRAAPLTGLRVVVASSSGEVAGRAETAFFDVPGGSFREVGVAELSGWVVRPGDFVWVCKDGCRPVGGVVPPVAAAPERR